MAVLFGSDIAQHKALRCCRNQAPLLLRGRLALCRARLPGGSPCLSASPCAAAGLTTLSPGLQQHQQHHNQLVPSSPPEVDTRTIAPSFGASGLHGTHLRRDQARALSLQPQTPTPELPRLLEQPSQATSWAHAHSPAEPPTSLWSRLLGAGAGALRFLGLAALVVSLLLSSPAGALARSSGGRVGGRAFGGGGGHMSAASSSAGRSSSSSSSRSGGGHSGGGGASLLGSASRRRTGGGGGGWWLSGSPSTSSSSSTSVYISSYSAPSVASYDCSRDTASDFEALLGALATSALLLFLVYAASEAVREEQGAGSRAPKAAVAVTRVQVALLASARQQLQDRFTSLADGADTGSREGLHRLLQDSLLELLRHHDQFAYGCVDEISSYDVRQAESELERLSLEERARFSDVTRSNFRGRKQRRSAGKAGDERPTGHAARGEQSLRPELDELVVVTLLVAAHSSGSGSGGQKRGAGGSAAGGGVRRALLGLGRVREDDLLAVELLWTPEAPGDAFSRDDLLAEYPHLAPM